MTDQIKNLCAVIMAGGSGTRFWPLSTGEMPKQFLTLFGDQSLLQMSRERIRDLIPPERTIVLTNEAFTGLVRQQLPDLPPDNVIGEPVRRDTAAAAALAAVILAQRFLDPVIATLTSDHLIEPKAAFQHTLAAAARAAEQTGALYTFGVKPRYPATAYGYLKRGERLATGDGHEHHRVDRFKEKPDETTARAYLDSGAYLWNSGMFMWKAQALLKEIERHLPQHHAALAPIGVLDRTPRWDAALQHAFDQIPSVSIDFGIMERAADVRCVAADFEWKDVGGWAGLMSHLVPDGQGNVLRGQVRNLDSADSLVFCEDPAETVVLLGVQDLIVVRAGDKTLIARRDRAEDLKQIVEEMQKK